MKFRSITLVLLLGLSITSPTFAVESTNSTTSQNEGPFKTPWFTGNKAHQYLGLSSLALGALAALAPKPEKDDYESSLHHQLALGATYLGGAALGTGLVFHYKDLSIKKMFHNPDNLHALLAVIGTAGFLLAVSAAPEESHATPGFIGIVGMASAIKITW
jgi:hypothetical protein